MSKNKLVFGKKKGSFNITLVSDANHAKHKGEKSTPKKVEVKEIQPDSKAEVTPKFDRRTLRKSKNKAYGLKGVFYQGDEAIVTTFGKGAEANYEQKVKDVDVYPIPGVRQTFVKTLVTGGKKDLDFYPDESLMLSAINPVTDRRPDALGIKPQLENTFFGRQYDDNIHVQMAYQILDLKKHVLFETSQAISSLLHLGNITDDNGEYITSIYPTDTMEVSESGELVPHLQRNKPEWYNNLYDRIRPYAIYFDNAIPVPNEKQHYYLEDAEADNFRNLKVLSILRNASAHGNVWVGYHEEPNLLFNIGANQETLNDIIDRSWQIYSDDVMERNRAFQENQRKNLLMIFELYPDVDKKVLYDEFYDFTVWKKQKNFGFDLHRIRKVLFDNGLDQKMQEADAFENLRGWNNNRKKAYLLYDFVFYRYYLSHPEVVEKIIAELRKLETKDEERKNQIYLKYSRLCVHENEKLFRDIIRVVKKYLKKKDRNEKGETGPTLTDLWAPYANLQPPEAAFVDEKESYLPMFLYLLSKFVDRKESNDMFTSWINAMENVLAFENLLIQRGEKEDSEFFGDSMGDIRTKNSLVKFIDYLEKAKALSQSKPNLKKLDVKNSSLKMTAQLYCDAINMFQNQHFVETKETSVEVLINKGKNKGKKGQKKKPLVVDDRGKEYMEILFSEKGSSGKKVRNFLINSILNSRRFIYILRHYSPKKCYDLIHNEAMVHYVLAREDMPKSQLDKYFQKIFPNVSVPESKEEIANLLAKELRQVSTDFIFNSYGQRLIDAQDSGDDDKIDSMKTLITLYLTVCYLLVKGVENTNAVFFVGFSCLDRDLYYKRNVDLEVLSKNSTKDNPLLSVDKNGRPNSKASGLFYLSSQEMEQRKKKRDEFKPLLDEEHALFVKMKKIGLTKAEEERFHYLHNRSSRLRKKRHDCNWVEKDYEEVLKSAVLFGGDGQVSGLYPDFRNAVSHFNVVYDFIDYAKDIRGVDSYYSIYARALEKMLLEKRNSELVQEFKNEYAKNPYSKSFLFDLNMPFLYNFARYQNLCIEDLFNDKYLKPKEQKKTK